MAFENTKIYISQGGDDMTVASGATLTVAGTLTMSGTETMSGTQTVSGTQTLSGTANVTGTLTMADGSAFKWAPQTETTSANLLNTGVSLVSDTGASRTFVMDAPAAGCYKIIIATAVTSTSALPTVKHATTTITFDGTNHRLAFDSTGSVVLVGRSATRWDIINTNGTITPNTT